MTAAGRSMPSLGRALMVPRAFVKRDWRIEASYRAGMLLRAGSAIVTVGMFFFLGRVFDSAAPALTDVGGSYFAFVLIGIVAQEFLSQSVGTFGGAMREPDDRTLELMRSAIAAATLLVSSTLWLHSRPGLVRSAYLLLGSIGRRPLADEHPGDGSRGRPLLVGFTAWLVAARPC